jgi:hypothetical protein
VVTEIKKLCLTAAVKAAFMIAVVSELSGSWFHRARGGMNGRSVGKDCGRVPHLRKKSKINVNSGVYTLENPHAYINGLKKQILPTT